MVALAFALAGIRWYFGVIVWIACGVFFAITALRTPRRGWVLAAALLLFAIVSQAVRFGGNGDVAPSVARVLDPQETLAALRQPARVTQVIAKARGGFERTPG